MKKITLLAICLLMACNLFATDYYVKATGSNTNDGLSEATALLTIVAAVTKAASGDKIFIVGSINHTATVNISTGLKSLTFQGMSNAVLTGGVARMFSITNPGLTYSFNDITFQGVTYAGSGGAVFIQTVASSSTFTNCVFQNNTSTVAGGGGAFTISGGNLTITNCSFINNSANGNAGAIQTTGGDLTISGSKFSGNTATNGSGGALYVGGTTASTFTLTTSTFNGNSSTNGSTASGGGVIVINNLRQALVSFCTFYDNISDLNGGGLHFISTNATSTVTNVSCFQNKLRVSTAVAANGAGIKIDGVRPFEITNTLVYGNLAATLGTPVASGISADSGQVALTLKNSLSDVIRPAPDGGDTITASNITANLTSSNLTYDPASGFVKFGLPTPGDATPIDFGTDGNDAGAWNSGLTLPATTWTGGTSSVWTNAANWSNGVPNSASDVTIGTSSNQPTLTINTDINSLTIVSGATLNVNEGKVLNVIGTITNNGDLVLKSSATGTASLLCNSSAANVTQKRYLSSNQRGWRLLSNPLATTTFNALASASNITFGTNYTGAYDSASNTWTSTDGAASMDTQKAYKVFITGLTGESPSYTTGPTNVTISYKGTAANTSPTSIPTLTGKYYLVANPYTAPVSLSAIIATSTGLSNTVSYYNPTKAATDVKVKAGGYDTVTVSGAAGSATDVVLPPMGAIFVQASSDGTITILKSAIYTAAVLGGSYNQKTAQTKIASSNALKVEVTSDGTNYDSLSLLFKAEGDSGSNVDFGKLPNTVLDFYSINGSNNMAVSELELKVQTIPLGISSTVQKNYTFKVAENTIPSGFEAVLVDNVLNTTTVLTPGTNYNFAIDSTPASQGDARFAINLKTAGTLGVIANELDASIQVYPNPSRGQFNITNALNQKERATIEISNLNGQVIHTQKLNSGTTTIQTKSWATGVYILKATNNGTQTTKKLIIQ